MKLEISRCSRFKKNGAPEVISKGKDVASCQSIEQRDWIPMKDWKNYEMVIVRKINKGVEKCLTTCINNGCRFRTLIGGVGVVEVE